MRPRVSEKRADMGAARVLVKKDRREGTLTQPSPAHDRGRGHEKNAREKERSARVLVKEG